MRPTAFHYVRASSKGEALHHLAQAGDEARLLAGGQSLVPMMNFRVARPSVLVDISRVRELAYVDQDGDGTTRIGATTTHRSVETAQRVTGTALAGLSNAARWIGHLPIRLRGTLGGSVAHGDPAAEWCVMATLLDAHVHVEGPAGSVSIPAKDFFVGYYSTAVAPGQMITEVEFPPVGGYCGLEEYAVRGGDFGIAVVGLAIERSEAGLARNARLAIGGVADRPLRIASAEVALEGASLTDQVIDDIAGAVRGEIDPSSDTAGSSSYRRHLTGVLVKRALENARADLWKDDGR